MDDVGPAMVKRHLGQMNQMSSKKWPAIVERDGYRIVSDYPYQGFDGDGDGPRHPWWPEPRFWCRSITVERICDGKRATRVGPQRDAYDDAVRFIEEDPS